MRGCRHPTNAGRQRDALQVPAFADQMREAAESVLSALRRATALRLKPRGAGASATAPPASSNNRHTNSRPQRVRQAAGTAGRRAYAVAKWRRQRKAGDQDRIIRNDLRVPEGVQCHGAVRHVRRISPDAIATACHPFRFLPWRWTRCRLPSMVGSGDSRRTAAANRSLDHQHPRGPPFPRKRDLDGLPGHRQQSPRGYAEGSRI